MFREEVDLDPIAAHSETERIRSRSVSVTGYDEVDAGAVIRNAVGLRILRENAEVEIRVAVAVEVARFRTVNVLDRGQDVPPDPVIITSVLEKADAGAFQEE